MLSEVTLSDWLNVIAILLSPLIALQIGKLLDKFSDCKRRKGEIFNTLMETRAQTLSYEHVRALNKVDVVFYKDKKVRESWTAYRDHLNSYPSTGTDTDQKIWTDKIPEKLADLLAQIAKLLKYDFDRTLLLKGAYLPSAYGRIDQENSALRQALVRTFALKVPLRVMVVANDEAEKQLPAPPK